MRCLEEVDVGGPLGAELAQVWRGREHIEVTGGAVEVVQTETLELRADGTFRHSVAHRFAFEGGGAQRRPAEDISCAGLWRLFKVRYAGPDSDGPVDRELSFTRAEDSPPLLVERLLVCGDSSGLSEFGGAACRLRPEQEDLDMENKIRARHGHGKRRRSYYELPFVSFPTHQLQKKQQEMLQKQQEQQEQHPAGQPAAGGSTVTSQQDPKPKLTQAKTLPDNSVDYDTFSSSLAADTDSSSQSDSVRG